MYVCVVSTGLFVGRNHGLLRRMVVYVAIGVVRGVQNRCAGGRLDGWVSLASLSKAEKSVVAKQSAPAESWDVIVAFSKQFLCQSW
jgi:hypothetical protein